MFRFTIRELLLLTVIAALSVVWWQDRNSLSRLSDELKSRNEQLVVLQKQPVETFDLETARLREQLTKRGPLSHFLSSEPYRRPLYDNVWLEALKARRRLEKDADAAGYVIRGSADGVTLELEPKWKDSWKEHPPVSDGPPGDI
jgi:hypothetical protein